MKIRLDANGYVDGFAVIGDISDSFEYDGVVPDDFTNMCKFYRMVDGALVFDAEKHTLAQNIEAMRNEMYALYEWFTWYDTQVMQYSRAQRLCEPCDIDIVALDTQAAAKQSRIREIRDMLREVV